MANREVGCTHETPCIRQTIHQGWYTSEGLHVPNFAQHGFVHMCIITSYTNAHTCFRPSHALHMSVFSMTRGHNFVYMLALCSPSLLRCRSPYVLLDFKISEQFRSRHAGSHPSGLASYGSTTTSAADLEPHR